MLNVKQGSCEYQLLKFFGLTRQKSNPSLPTTSHASLIKPHFIWEVAYIVGGDKLGQTVLEAGLGGKFCSFKKHFLSRVLIKIYL